MGLDITAYEKVARIVDGDEGRGWRVWDGNFPGRCAPLEPGYYENAGDDWCVYTFGAGSYLGYSAWRVELSRFALGCEPEQVWKAGDTHGGPFVELINFTDCDGSIGPTVAAKLARDFAGHEERAVAFADSLGAYGSRFADLYRDFRRAFELAARGGVVIFH